MYIDSLSRPTTGSIQLKINIHTAVRNTTDEQAAVGTQIIHRTLGNIFLLTQGDLHFKMQKHGISAVNEVDKY